MNYEWMWNELKSWMKDSIDGEEYLPTTEWLEEMLSLERIEAGGKTGPERVAEAIKKDRGGDAAPTVRGWA